MKILGNPILSKNFAHNNLLLNNDGLFLPIEDKYLLFITSDPVKIVGLLDMNFDEFDKKSMVELFPLFESSPFIKLKAFRVDTTKGRNKCFLEFSEYLKGKDISRKYEKITTEYLLEYFKDESDFIESYKKSQTILSNTLVKFSGKTILKYVPNYNVLILNTTLPYFLSNYFENKLEKDYFLVTNSEADIVSKFVEVTENLDICI